MRQASINSQSVLNQHWSLWMFAYNDMVSRTVRTWAVQRFLCEKTYAYIQNYLGKFATAVVVLFFKKKKLVTKNLRHFQNMFEMWSFTNKQVKQFRIIVVKNSRILFWKTKVFCFKETERFLRVQYFHSGKNHINIWFTHMDIVAFSINIVKGTKKVIFKPELLKFTA